MENPYIFLLVKEKTCRRIFNINSELSQNRTEKQIMPSKTAINWLFNDIWCYLFIACFDWKIGVFKQTVVRVYYILNAFRTMVSEVYNRACIKGTLLQFYQELEFLVKSDHWNNRYSYLRNYFGNFDNNLIFMYSLINSGWLSRLLFDDNRLKSYLAAQCLIIKTRRAMVKYKYAMKNKIQMIEKTYWETLKTIFFQIKFDNVSIARM